MRLGPDGALYLLTDSAKGRLLKLVPKKVAIATDQAVGYQPEPRKPKARSEMSDNRVTRRDVLRQVGAVVAATALPGDGCGRGAGAGGRQPGAQVLSGLQAADAAGQSASTINGAMAGQGPPVLLLHGAPQSMISWRLVAPDLAKDHTVVVTDLRGYGDSSKPPDGENHANYSKRAMALDQVEVMRQLGIREVRRVRPRSRRSRRPSHGARSSRSRHATGGARHRSDLLPLHARHAAVRAGLLPLVQLSASVADARE